MRAGGEENILIVRPLAIPPGGCTKNLPMNTTQRILAVGALLLGLTASASAASPWSTHLRATYLQTADKSDAFTALGIAFPSDAVSISDRLIPEIDVDYAFNDVFSAELVLTIPQKHSVALAGVGHLGSFQHLPPTLLFQYRANPGGDLRPYVGIGLNYTFIFSDKLSVAGIPLGLDSHSAGFAFQVGADWKLNDRWALNVDLKNARLNTGVYAGAAKLTEVQVDPWLYSVGLHWSF